MVRRFALQKSLRKGECMKRKSSRSIPVKKENKDAKGYKKIYILLLKSEIILKQERIGLRSTLYAYCTVLNMQHGQPYVRCT